MLENERNTLIRSIKRYNCVQAYMVFVLSDKLEEDAAHQVVILFQGYRVTYVNVICTVTLLS